MGFINNYGKINHVRRDITNKKMIALSLNGLFTGYYVAIFNEITFELWFAE